MGYTTDEIGTVLEAVASDCVAPASGSVIAIVGAFGAALVEMAAIQSNPSAEQPGSNEKGPTSMQATRSHQRTALLNLAAADSRTVDSIYAGQDIPSQADVTRGTGIPLTIARSCTTVLENAAAIESTLTDPVKPDFNIGVVLLQTAAKAALAIVEENMTLIDNKKRRAEFVSQAEDVRENLETCRSMLDLERP